LTGSPTLFRGGPIWSAEHRADLTALAIGDGRVQAVDADALAWAATHGAIEVDLKAGS